MDLTFVYADIPLAKTITPKEVRAYPLVKNLTSYEVEVNTLDEMLIALREAASKNHALYKGHFIHPLENESRAGKTADVPTSFVVLDLDDVSLPKPLSEKTSAEELTEILEGFKQSLPEPWCSTRAIGHASSRWGLDKASQKLRAHLFFILDKPLEQEYLKNALINLNLTHYKDDLKLANSGFSLKYPIDVCCAENARIIYIAPPILKDIENPFDSDDDRFVILAGEHDLLDTSKLDITYAIDRIRAKVRSLRRAMGLKSNIQPKLRSINVDNKPIQVLLNPPKGKFTYSYSARGFVYYNLNGGDSNAYYHPEGNPEYMYNFKGEPVVRFRDVDEETYNWYCKTFKDDIIKKNPTDAFAVIGYYDDRIYRVYHDRVNGIVNVLPGTKQNLEDFYASIGKIYSGQPGELDYWKIEYDPSAPPGVDHEKRIINSFQPSPYMEIDFHTSETVKTLLHYNNAGVLEKIAPNVYTLINHVVGGSVTEFNHYINWLAYIWQRREKPGTAWIFSGVEGTGKGIMARHILIPLFGQQNVQTLLMNNIEDNFTEWRLNKLLVIIDEFDMTASGRKSRVIATLKNWITETVSPIRGMHKHTITAPVFDNYICFTNVHGALDIPESDRRWNIAPRQERPLRRRIRNIERFIENIEEELPNFVGFLNDWHVDATMARTALDNQAKSMMKRAATSMLQSFLTDLVDGNIDAVLEVLCIQGKTPTELFKIELLKEVIKKWVSDSLEEQDSVVFLEDVADIYNVLTGEKITGAHIGKALSRRGIATTRLRAGSGRRGMALVIRWKSASLTDKELEDFYNNTLVTNTILAEARGDLKNAIH